MVLRMEKVLVKCAISRLDDGTKEEISCDDKEDRSDKGQVATIRRIGRM